MQNRRGPNRVGWAGLLQPAADGVKNIMKEETYPGAREPLRSSCWRRRCRSFRRCSLRRVIPFAAPLPVDFDFTSVRWADSRITADADGRRRPADRLPLRPRDQLARRLRHRARGLVVEQQVRAARRAPAERADDLLRDRDGDEPRSRCCCSRGNVSFSADHRDQQARPLERAAAVRSRSSSSWSRPSPRPTGCRSTCPRRSPS